MEWAWSGHGVGMDCMECTWSAQGVGMEWAWSLQGLHGLLPEIPAWSQGGVHNPFCGVSRCTPWSPWSLQGQLYLLIIIYTYMEKK